MKRRVAMLLCCLLLAAMLTACAGGAGAPAEETPAEAAVPAEEAPAPAQEAPPAENAAEGAGAYSGVATAEDMTAVEEVAEEGMTPVPAESITDGVYDVVMKSSSSMFKAERCELAVSGGEMTVTLYMSSDSYAFMFAGTAAEAAASSPEDFIPLVENADGTRTFTLPLEALDQGSSFAAFSRRKELWYDRTLLFRADSLPLDAFLPGVFPTAETLGLADGEYTVEVALSGGSGRATVVSPAPMTVENGACSVALEWGSSRYDYMVVDGETYPAVNTEGNSRFLIPVRAFDRSLTVLADLTGSGESTEIEYVLRFDSDSILPAGA